MLRHRHRALHGVLPSHIASAEVATGYNETRRWKQLRAATIVSGMLAVSLGFHLDAWAQAACALTETTHTEQFTDTNYEDSANTSAVGWGTGTVTLPVKGSASLSQTGALGFKPYAMAAADFDNDDLDDLVVLVRTPTCELHLAKNQGMGAGEPPVHNGFDFGGGGVIGSSGWLAQRVAILGCRTDSSVIRTGDVDGDGDTDILYLDNWFPNSWGLLRAAYLYVNNGINLTTGFPTFTRVIVTSTLRAAGTLSWHMNSASMAQLIDWNGDGRDDLVFASSFNTDNRVLLFPALTDRAGFSSSYVTLLSSAEMATPIASNSASASSGTACPPSVSRGITVVLPADYDDDGDFDLVVGSVSETDLHYFVNDGANSFTRMPDLVFAEGGALLGTAFDADGDGDIDVAIGRDGKSCGGTGGTGWIFANDGAGTFTKNPIPVANLGGDLDMGLVFEADNDSQNRLDYLFADRKSNGTYTLIPTKAGKLYNMTASAQSKALNAPSTQGIVSARFVSWDVVVPTGTTARFYISNDDGENWDELTGDKLPPTSATHSFTHFGSQLRWRVDFEGKTTILVGEEAPFFPASRDTPELNSLQVVYGTVPQRTYTRSGLATGTVTISGSDKELLFASTFEFPTFRSKLTAFDLSALSEGGGSTEQLERVDDDLTTEWEAGARLQAKAGDARILYTAVDADGGGPINDRIMFHEKELSSPSTNPTLQSLMGVTDGEKISVMQFLRNGLGALDGWKFYDVGHSSPVFVASPPGDPAYLGQGYGAFQAANASRDPAVFVGANDGYLRSLDARTGEERWGFVPHNLLGKMKEQRHTVDTNIVYRHRTFVDGTITVQDVYDGTDWKTLLVTGQAQGQGKNDNNYYVALDVTDPDDPLPLWEFTDAWDTPKPTCSGDPCRTGCTQICDPMSCDTNCDPLKPTYYSPEYVDSSDVVVMEAEHFSANVQIRTPHQWQENVTDVLASNGSFQEALPNQGRNCGSNITSCGAEMTYDFSVSSADRYYAYFRIRASNGGDDSLKWGLDEEQRQQLHTSPDDNTWAWVRSSRFDLDAGEHTFHVWMREDGQKLDKVVIQKSSSAPTGMGPAVTCGQTCLPPTCRNDCSEVCVGAGDEWPECGVGAGLKCCTHGEKHFCEPLAQACSESDTVTGETWSYPIIGKTRIAGADRWLVFFASGYNNRVAINVGRSIYAVDAFTGAAVARWDTTDLVASAANPSTIDNTIPGGPALVDLDDDSYVDRLYVGDLEGRLWKVDLTKDAAIDGGTGLVRSADWPQCVLLDAGDPNQTGTRTWAPVITRPAVAILDAGNLPHVYFGTGGDDRAPNTLGYKFYGVKDDDAAGDCRATPKRETELSVLKNEWVVGDGKTNTHPPTTLSAAGLAADAEGATGDRYWSDPLIVNNNSIFFASLNGLIESVNPCDSVQGGSKFYAFAIKEFRDDAGVQRLAGESLLSDPWAQVNAKIRRAAIERGMVSQGWSRASTSAATKTDVLVTAFSGETAGDAPAISRLSTSGTASQTRIRVLRWREIPL